MWGLKMNINNNRIIPQVEVIHIIALAASIRVDVFGVVRRENF